MKTISTEVASEIERLLPEASRQSGLLIEDLRHIIACALEAVVAEGGEPYSAKDEAYHIIRMALDLYELM